MQEDDPRAEIFDLMRTNRVDRITLEYSGSGDSGQVDDIYILMKDSNSLSPTIGKHLDELLLQYCYEILGSYYGGWEINEGSSGSMIFFDNTIEWLHSENVMTTQEHQVIIRN